jgi:4-alpha-glucanotransferase
MSSLDTLSQNYGIQAAALNARGEEVVTTPAAKMAMLAAMGVDARDEDLALTALSALEHEEWNNPLPPVLVTYADTAPICVPIVMPTDTEVVHWLVTCEDGLQRCGKAKFEELELIQERTTSAQSMQRRLLIISERLALGYHKMRLAAEPMEMSLIVTPRKCWLPEGVNRGDRFWGISAQLYLLRSEHNWGIGDLTDLRHLIETAKESGADIVGVNPLHAMFPDSSEQASPYSPSDRNLLNILNIDVEAIPEFAESVEAKRLTSSTEFSGAIENARQSDHVTYSEVAARKIEALKLVFEAFCRNKSVKRCNEFSAFIDERASLLDRACTFQALRAHFADRNPHLADSKNWPDEFRNFRSPAVARWAGENRSLVEFQLWMQWIADQQLKAASEAASTMAIGLYRDLAVGSDPAGAEMWCHSDALLPNVHIGAPADIWNPAGQDWGLPPFHPKRLRHEAYRPFIELLQSNMRYSGALRIDHAMALKRLYWIPASGKASDGAFIEYPMDDLIGILALESHRNRCLVIGEDLGTVPAGFRERMQEANVLSYKVLFFERNEQGFARPEDYPYLSLSVASSHDLPTLSGWWLESDLNAKATLNLFPSPTLEQEARQQRTVDRRDLISRLRSQNLISCAEVDPQTFSSAAHGFLGRTGSMITLIQLDDLTGEIEQVNMPATTDATNPNWRRKQSISLEDLNERTELNELASALQETRGVISRGVRQ